MLIPYIKGLVYCLILSMTCRHVYIQTVLSIVSFSTIFAGVCKHIRKVNTFHMVHYVPLLRIRFSTHCADRHRFSIYDLLLDIFMQDAPVWLTA